GDDAELRVAEHLAEVARADVGHQIEGVEHQGLRHDALVGVGLHDDVLDRRLALEIAGIGREQHLALRVRLHKDIGTRADRMSGARLGAAPTMWFGRILNIMTRSGSTSARWRCRVTLCGSTFSADFRTAKRSLFGTALCGARINRTVLTTSSALSFTSPDGPL